jgi:hypothetical protein
MIVNLNRKHICQILHTQIIYAIPWVFSCSRWKAESDTPVCPLGNPLESDIGI